VAPSFMCRMASVGPQQQHGRGSNGVSITLSSLATAAWERAGRELHDDCGDRLIGVRLEVRGGRRGKAYQQKMGIFLVSSYAPTSAHTTAERNAHEANLARLIARRRPGDVLVIGTDANASIGRGSLQAGSNDSERRGAVGPFGIPFVNAAGRQLRSFLETQQLASLSSFYRKRHYGTWIHPCSKLDKQLDHILVSQADRRRFTDAGSCPFQMINSDHRAVGCRMRFAVSLERKPDPRSAITRLDLSSLYTSEGQQAYARRAVQCAVPSPPLSGHTQIDPSRPSLTQPDSTPVLCLRQHRPGR